MDEDFWVGFVAVVLLPLLLLLAIIPAVIAARKGRSGLKWYAYGFFFWIVALVHALMLPKRRCPFCAEAIRPEAKVCPHCQREFVSLFMDAPQQPAMMLEGV